MDVMEQRRELLLAVNSKTGKLRYWFDGNDAPINGAWQDKISGIRFVLYKNGSTTNADTLWNQEQGCYIFNGKDNDYALLPNMNTVNFNWGNHWRFEFDIEQNGKNSTSAFWDLGSIGNSSKALGFSLVPAAETNPRGTMSMNWKLLGNDSNPGLSLPPPEPVIISNEDEFVRYTGYYAIVDGGDGYDRLHRMLNEASDIASVLVPKTQYGPTWANYRSYIGRGVLSNSYYSNVKIHSFKVYVID